MNFSMRSEKNMQPTLSLFFDAEKASVAAISVMTFCLEYSVEPNVREADTSTASIIVSSRSSSYTLIWGLRARAVTFQSISRTSSPARYSLTSANDMPRPRKAVWYLPANISSDNPRVLISILRTRLSISFSVSCITAR